MEPQHLARLDDDGSAHTSSAARVGGSAAASPEGPEVPALAPVLLFSRSLSTRRSRRLLGATPVSAPGVCPSGRRSAGPRSGADVVASDAWALPLEADGLALADVWPLPVDVDALLLGGAPVEEDADHDDLAAPGLTPAQVVPAVASGAWPLETSGTLPRHPASAGPLAAAVLPDVAGGKHRRPTARNRRPVIYLAAALIGVAGIAATAAGDTGHVAQAADAEEPVSVAEELGLVQADQPALTGDEAAERLSAMVATRAEREDAQAAAAQVQASADQVALQAAADAAAEAVRPTAVLPVQGARLSSGFGYRWGTLHAGIDFAAPLGTPEHAAMKGVVIRAGAASGFGLAVYLQHENGDVTVYGHMQEILVEEGQTVRAGDTIALLGNRGQSTGPHLHFEVYVGGLDGEKIDPLPWLRERGVQV